MNEDIWIETYTNNGPFTHAAEGQFAKMAPKILEEILRPNSRMNTVSISTDKHFPEVTLNAT